MSDNREYYDILGIKNDTGTSEIKKAYHKLSKECHPDKLKRDTMTDEEYHKACDKFAKISSAYDVLGDPERRKLYDKYGLQAMNEIESMKSQGMGGFDLSALKQKTPCSVLRHTTPLENVYNGKTGAKASIGRKRLCNACDGTGNKSKVNNSCTSCNGKGRVIKEENGQASIVPCKSCKGKGKIGKHATCEKCNGKRIMEEYIDLIFDIPKGANKKTPIVLKGEGGMNPRNPSQVTDVAIEIDTEDHEIFKKFNENDLYMKLEVTTVELLCGFNKTITHMDGHKITLQNTDMVYRHGSLLKATGEGMPCSWGTGFGDLYVRLVPKPDEEIILHEEERATIYKILTNRDYSEYSFVVPEDSCKVHLSMDNVTDKNMEKESEMLEEAMQDGIPEEILRSIHMSAANGMDDEGPRVQTCVHQ
jgi:DnaJ-class molecular chaperone